MTQPDRFDRLLAGWLAESAPASAPQALHAEAMQRVRRASSVSDGWPRCGAALTCRLVGGIRIGTMARMACLLALTLSSWSSARDRDRWSATSHRLAVAHRVTYAACVRRMVGVGQDARGSRWTTRLPPCLTNGTVLIAGGENGTAEIYDPTKWRVLAGPDLSVARRGTYRDSPQ